jgi:hypothetical protein
MQRYQKTAIPQYQEFVNAYNNHNIDDLHKIAQTHAELFNKVGFPPVYSKLIIL